MLGSNPNLLLIRGGRIVGRVQKFAKLPNLNGFREFESHPSRHKWPDSVPNQIFGALDCFLTARPEA